MFSVVSIVRVIDEKRRVDLSSRRNRRSVGGGDAASEASAEASWNNETHRVLFVFSS